MAAFLICHFLRYPSPVHSPLPLLPSCSPSTQSIYLYLSLFHPSVIPLRIPMEFILQSDSNLSHSTTTGITKSKYSVSFLCLSPHSCSVSYSFFLLESGWISPIWKPFHYNSERKAFYGHRKRQRTRAKSSYRINIAVVIWGWIASQCHSVKHFLTLHIKLILT